MMWMLLGVGTMVSGGPIVATRKDSAALAELRSHLPEDLRIRVDQARKELQSRHDTLARLTPAERTQWLDSLRREAINSRSKALDNLTPQERERIEQRLHELERQLEQRPRSIPSRDPNQGFRQ